MTERDTPADTPERLAELLVHIARSARCEPGAAGEGGGDDVAGTPLTPAQWSALRFFARANQGSRTPSAFASFQATTRGTASQTIKTLEARGLLSRRRAEDDGRSVRFDLTAAGRVRLAGDPLRHLGAVLAGLDERARDALARILPEIADRLAAERGGGAIGTCATCDHYAAEGQGGYCACMAAGLSPGEIGQLCARYAPRVAG